MRKSGWILSLLAAAALLGGCEETREMLGQAKNAPDEFAVYSRAPLSLPPDYGQLVPPSPGTTRPQSVDPTVRAQEIMVGDTRKRRKQTALASATRMSRGLRALLTEAGAFDADPNIRSIVNRETTILAEEDMTFAESIMFWNTPGEYGTAVDPIKETKRIQETQALGKAVNEGETPTIERKRKALLEGLFD